MDVSHEQLFYACIKNKRQCLLEQDSSLMATGNTVHFKRRGFVLCMAAAANGAGDNTLLELLTRVLKLSSVHLCAT